MKYIVLALLGIAGFSRAQQTNSLGMKLVPVPGTKILMATTEVTVDQYKAAGLGYESPKFPQGGNHPAVNVSWNDAKKYCAWLSKKEGKKYRLPTDHEWSCAVGIGHLENPADNPASKSEKIVDVYPWGKGKPSGKAGNYMGQEWNSPMGIETAQKYGFKRGEWSLVPGYHDGVLFTSAVGNYSPNTFGIYDLGGNVWELCEDKFGGNGYDKSMRVQRGGSWGYFTKDFVLSSSRIRNEPGSRSDNIGFRVVCIPIDKP